MKLSEVYRKAAEMIAVRNIYSCCAVDMVCGSKNMNDWSPATKEYQQRFGNKNGFLPISYFTDEEDPRGLRILALCFMAAIAEDEERSRKRRN